MTDYSFDHIYDVPTDKVLDLLRDVEVDNRTQEQICKEFEDNDKVVFEFEIVPCHLKMKSKIIRMKKSVTTIDKLAINRTYLRQAV